MGRGTSKNVTAEISRSQMLQVVEITDPTKAARLCQCHRSMMQVSGSNYKVHVSCVTWERWMGHLSEGGEDSVSEGCDWSRWDTDSTDQIRCCAHYALPRLPFCEWTPTRVLAI